MELSHALKEYGLDGHEADTYLALLQLGASPVLAISRRIGLKRPTLYLILDGLIEKGFVALVPQEKKKLYFALPPERFTEELGRRMKMIQSALPELAALHRTQTSKPNMRLFESREGMMNVYREVISSGASEILSFFSLEAIPPELKEAFDIFIQALKEKKIKSREIVYAKDRDHYYLKRTKYLPNYEARFTSAERKFFIDSFIYGNKVAVFSFKKRFALVIENEDIARSLRSLFELAWLSAAPR